MMIFLFLIPVVYAGVPDDWVCKPLDQQGSFDEDCITSKSFANGVHTISTNTAHSVHRICVATLTAADLLESENFYLKATFNKPPNSNIFFGGVTYNMEDPKHGNYILLRIGIPRSNLEVGFLDDGIKTKQAIYTAEQAKQFPLTVEVLIKDGEETIWLNGEQDTTASGVEPHFSVNGKVGIGIQNLRVAQIAQVSDAQLCTPVLCAKDDDSIIMGGDTFTDADGLKECTCTRQGIHCKCPSRAFSCPGGTSLWEDPEICESKCIRPPAYCTSYGDPHYLTFDHKYYDFHGVCTYQAASCGDFTVYFKNVDLLNRPPRYTMRIELKFKENKFVIGAGLLVAVVDLNEKNPASNVAIPYMKKYNDGSRVEIVNNGQLEIRLYSKDREPAVRLRSTNAGNYINAEMWLHGSCADITEGLCGNMNGNNGDDLLGNDPNQTGEQYQEYDENCPAPPPPPDVCKDLIPGTDMTDDAYKKCQVLKQEPFSSCHDAIPIGGKEGPGVLKDCITDACNCFLDEGCICQVLEAYASECINQGVDLSNWAKHIHYCPMTCPEGMTYKPHGASPPATCGAAAGTDKVRGCFCPDDKVFQDGKCISSSECKCLHEGVIYNTGDEIKKEVECKVCTCQDGGEMSCEDMQCPGLDCKDNEIESRPDDKCCFVCDDSWVKALNPEVKADHGHKVILTCQINAEGVKKKDITWSKDGRQITDGISKNKLMLTLDNVDADDSGTYTCKAQKDGKTGSDDFTVEVKAKEQCEHDDDHKWDVGTKYSPTDVTECLCKAGGEIKCGCKDDGEECPAATPVEWFDDGCVKTCVPEHGLCQASTDPHYTSFDGKRFDFKGSCIYHIFQCDNVAITADHEKDKASTHTKAIEFSYKEDTYKLEKGTVTLNGAEVTVPLDKPYNDGASLKIEDVGDYKLRFVKNGMDPFVAVTWDKQSTYSIEAHGSCKGKTKGMCGNWNDDEADDFEGKDGKVKDSAEAFGQSWALDDEIDCPVEPPPPSVCDTMGFKHVEKEFKKYIESLFAVGVMKDCFDEIGDETVVQNAVDDICFCQGDKGCACPIFTNFATQCKEKAGIDTDGWQLNNPDYGCPPECPTGTKFLPKGPKPAPTCASPDGGEEQQPGCFCAKGRVLQEGKCVAVSECKCEYAGELFSEGDSYTKEETCESCTCRGGGKESCKVVQCDVRCKEGDTIVEVDGKCCPECQGVWLTAVNPDAVGELGESLELTCEVDAGVRVTNVKWIKFNPGEKDVTNLEKKYSVSADGLTLTIKTMAEDMTGNYKCVGEATGETKAEAKFKVSSPAEHEDLIDPDEADVVIVPGEDVTLKVEKLGGVITTIYWECNGERIASESTEYKIVNTNNDNTLTILDADEADAGKCVCVAEGVGTEDKAVFNLNHNTELMITVNPIKEDVECEAGKRKCTMKYRVTAEKANEAIKVKRNFVKICKLINGNLRSCKKAAKACKGPNFCRRLKPKVGDAGKYVAVVTIDDQTAESDPVTLTVVRRTEDDITSLLRG